MGPSLTFIADLANKTGDHLLDYFKPNGTTPTLKDDRSLVTEADISADRLILEAISERYPDSKVLSEELSPRLDSESSPVWVVDPLDGTTNFSLGLPIWGVSIAQVEDGFPVAAAIYFPVLKEIYTAQIGQGAWLNGDGIRASPSNPGNPNTFFTCCSRTLHRYEVNLRYKTRILGSACYSICAVARGMALIGLEATPKIWDIAASWLIVGEAGGVIETFDGSRPFPLQPGCDYRHSEFPTLAAGTPDLLAHARREIRLKS
jgi:myo-inositol-1(or 4)-monophosphatase